MKSLKLALSIVAGFQIGIPLAFAQIGSSPQDLSPDAYHLWFQLNLAQSEYTEKAANKTLSEGLKRLLIFTDKGRIFLFSQGAAYFSPKKSWAMYKSGSLNDNGRYIVQTSRDGYLRAQRIVDPLTEKIYVDPESKLPIGITKEITNGEGIIDRLYKIGPRELGPAQLVYVRPNEINKISSKIEPHIQQGLVSDIFKFVPPIELPPAVRTSVF